MLKTIVRIIVSVFLLLLLLVLVLYAIAPYNEYSGFVWLWLGGLIGVGQ